MADEKGKKIFPFFKLRREMRDAIYAYAYCSEHLCPVISQYGSRRTGFMLYATTGANRKPLHRALTVNKQYYKQALSLFIQNVTLFVSCGGGASTEGLGSIVRNCGSIEEGISSLRLHISSNETGHKLGQYVNCFPRLVDVETHIYDTPYWKPASNVQVVLDSLKEMRGLRTFKVQICGWTEEQVREEEAKISSCVMLKEGETAVEAKIMALKNLEQKNMKRALADADGGE